MALVKADRVKVSTTTIGTGTYTIGSTSAGFQGFAAIGDGNTAQCMVTDGTDWEIGLYTYTASGTTLARTTIYASSNANAAVSWSAGTKTIVVTYPASKAVTLDGAETLTNKTLTSPTMTAPVLGTPFSGTLTSCTGLPGSALTGAFTAAAMTMATARLLGRTTASSGAAEEISVGTGLLLSGGTLVASALAQPVASGTSNPGSPADKDLFFRTDLGLMIYYRSSLSKWMTINEYAISLTVRDALEPGAVIYGPVDNSQGGMYLERLAVTTYIAATNNGSTYWTVQLKSISAANVGSNVGASFNTSADTQANYVTHTLAIGATLASTEKLFQLNATQTGSPGAYYAAAMVFYRIIVN